MQYNFNLPEDVGLTVDELLSSVNQLEVYQMYIPEIDSIRKKYHSPFSPERTPSFCLYYVNGILRFKDFSSGFQGSCVDFVMLKENCRCKQAISIIYNKIKPVSINRTSVVKESKTIEQEDFQVDIKVVLREFSSIDEKIWNPIPLKVLNDPRVDIKACKEVWLDYGDSKLELWALHTESNPIYRYRFNNRIKCYKPNEKNKKRKWLSNTRYYDIQGWNLLPKTGETLIITKSYKDVLVLSFLMGIPAIAPQAEGNTLHKDMIKHLKNRFNNIVILYDNDDAGKRLLEKASKDTGLPIAHIPEYEFVKDVFEACQVYGVGYTKNSIIVPILNKTFYNDDQLS